MTPKTQHRTICMQFLVTERIYVLLLDEVEMVQTV